MQKSTNYSKSKAKKSLVLSKNLFALPSTGFVCLYHILKCTRSAPACLQQVDLQQAGQNKLENKMNSAKNGNGNKNPKIPKGYRLKVSTHKKIKELQGMINGSQEWSSAGQLEFI